MVTKKTIRGVGRRMLLAFLASASVAGTAGLSAAAGPAGKMPTVGGPAPSIGLQDLDLAPGEKVIKSSTPIAERLVQHDGGSYQIVDSSSVPTASSPMMDSSMSEMPMMGQPQAYGASSYGGHATGGCASGNCGGGCATGNCGGGCASGNCGGGYSMGGYGGPTNGGKGSGGNVCGPTCNPYLYAAVETLYIKNSSVNNYTLSPSYALRDFDYELGARATVGMVPDCRNGYEISFVTPINWYTEARFNGPGTFLFPQAPLVAGNLSAYNNATSQAQRYEAQYYSVEGNRTLIGWEICKLLYGIRYVNYEEDYFYRSTSAAGSGLLQSSTQNKMIGGQVGAEMTYPLTCKLWSDFRGRAGVYADFAENQLQLNNAGTVVSRNFDEKTDVVGLFEFGGGLRYYVNDDFHLRAGTELWYLTGIATAAGQFSNAIAQGSGNRISTNDDVLLFGISLGAEYKF